MRLFSTWPNRTGSPTTLSGRWPCNSNFKSMPLSVALFLRRLMLCPRISLRLKVISSSSIFPASILLKSRISLIIASKFSPENFKRLRLSIWSSLGSSSSIRFVNPIIAFMGVRISWLIVLKNILFALDASSALSFASFNASSSNFLSLMLRWDAKTNLFWERSSLNIFTCDSNQMYSPSFFRSRITVDAIGNLFWRISSPLARTIWISSGWVRSKILFFPISSSRSYPSTSFIDGET